MGCHGNLFCFSMIFEVFSEMEKKNRSIFVFFFFLGFGSLALQAQEGFRDVTIEAGINHSFRVFQGTFGGGAAVFDFNNDGAEDLFLAGGVGGDALYRNNGDGTFLNVAREAGLTGNDTLITQGAVTADVNKDGFIDIYVTTIASSSFGRVLPRARDILYLNDGEGHFIDASKAFGLTDETFSTGAAFGDVNGDGFPDLFVGHYFDQFEGDLDKINAGVITGSQRPSRDHLYLNSNGTSFINVSDKFGIGHEGFGFGGVFTDFDNDRDLDLYVINDFGNRATKNKLYVNDYPHQEFIELSGDLKVDFGINAMGTAVGDYNQDGMLDYVVTNISVSPFMVNQGPGKPFLQQATALGTGINSLVVNETGSVAPVSWGCNFFDFDLDTDLDLFLCNGALNPTVTPNPNLFFEFNDSRFEEKAAQYGLNDPGLGRGSVTFDYDGDGDLDLFVVNQRPVENAGLVGTVKSKLLRNETISANWLKVKLAGVSATTRGLGCRVEVIAGPIKLIREIDGGSSHESQNSTIAHFGLANYDLIDTVRVHWIGGSVQTLTNIEVNQLVEIKQEASQKIESPFNNGKVRIFPSYFTSEVTVEYELPIYTRHTLIVLDEAGKVVDRLIEPREGFFGTVIWEVPTSLKPGLYFFVVYLSNEKFVARGFKK